MHPLHIMACKRSWHAKIEEPLLADLQEQGMPIGVFMLGKSTVVVVGPHIDYARERRIKALLVYSVCEGANRARARAFESTRTAVEALIGAVRSSLGLTSKAV